MFPLLVPFDLLVFTWVYTVFTRLHAKSLGCVLRRALRDGEPAEERARKEASIPVTVALITLGALMFAAALWLPLLPGRASLLVNKQVS